MFSYYDKTFWIWKIIYIGVFFVNRRSNNLNFDPNVIYETHLYSEIQVDDLFENKIYLLVLVVFVYVSIEINVFIRCYLL